MDTGDVDVVVWPESVEREAWWRQIVTGGSADASPSTPNRNVPDTPSRILRAA
ncbi:hypothetical protein ACHMZP_33390 [Rhodococcus baikonurensis]|uniref:hypothetical protein n=1 Tax=Rhodococcus baikonurensis TaxID=172041 RepID=UPI0037B9D426